ncbi:MAG: WhiB family transcriptional regulator [Acidimicrobiales bacterium]
MLAQLHNEELDLTRRADTTGDIPVLDLALEVDTSFWADAACAEGAGALVRIFFSEELRDIAAAKRICAECPVMHQCLEGALARKEPLGVWGGQLFQNGKILHAKRRRGRPPKSPRPEDEFVHVEVPAALRHLAEHRTA